jgi:hypothetical protein
VVVNATTRFCVGPGTSGHGGGINCESSPGLVGYWDNKIPAEGNLNATSKAFAYFPRGEYTVLGTFLAIGKFLLAVKTLDILPD